MKYFVTAALIVLSISAYADGIMQMKIEKVVPMAELIIEAEVIDNKGSKKIYKESDEVRSVEIVNDVKIKVLSVIHGQSDKKQMGLKYTELVIKGVWVETPGSGLEGAYKKGDKCIALINKAGKLIRLEKCESRETIIKLLKNKNQHN